MPAKAGIHVFAGAAGQIVDGGTPPAVTMSAADELTIPLVGITRRTAFHACAARLVMLVSDTCRTNNPGALPCPTSLKPPASNITS